MLNSQYANRFSTYGNIQYGKYSLPFLNYGGWLPRKHEEAPFSVESDIVSEQPIQQVALHNYADEVANRAAIVRELTAQIKAARQAAEAEILREQRKIERQAMERAAKLKNIVDDEEALFILFQ